MASLVMIRGYRHSILIFPVILRCNVSFRPKVDCIGASWSRRLIRTTQGRYGTLRRDIANDIKIVWR